MNTGPKKYKCKVCGNDFEKRFTTTQRVCSVECALEEARRKRQAQADKEHRQRKRAFNEADKQYQTRRAVRACHSYILLRDSNEPCISCGTRSGKFYAGHFKSAGGHPAIRFHWANINKQCFRCNFPLSGNYEGYRKGLIEKVGLPMVEYLETDHPAQHRTAEDLSGIAEWFTGLAKPLRNHE